MRRQYLEPVTAQRVQNFVLNRFDGGRKIGDEMVRIGIETDHDRAGEEFRQLVIRTPGFENLVVNPRQEILLKPR